MDVLLSIHPKYASEILDGTKRYEFRRVVPARPVERVFLYATAPVSKIVGYFYLGATVHETPENMWEWCMPHGTITKDELFEYFKGMKKGYALEIYRPYRFKPAVEFPNKKVAQNFRYVSNPDELGLVMQKLPKWWIFKQITTETKHTDTQRLDFLLEYFSISDIGDECAVSAVSIQSEDLEVRLGHGMAWEADIRDVIDRAMGEGERDEV